MLASAAGIALPELGVELLDPCLDLGGCATPTPTPEGGESGQAFASVETPVFSVPLVQTVDTPPPPPTLPCERLRASFFPPRVIFPEPMAVVGVVAFVDGVPTPLPAPLPAPGVVVMETPVLARSRAPARLATSMLSDALLLTSRLSSVVTLLVFSHTIFFPTGYMSAGRSRGWLGMVMLCSSYPILWWLW